jgi:hypothetical protein
LCPLGGFSCLGAGAAGVGVGVYPPAAWVSRTRLTARRATRIAALPPILTHC